MHSDTPIQPSAASCFDALLSSTDCARPCYNEILAEMHGCVVAPTLGSIIPNWLLIVPRSHSINFLSWQRTTGINPYHLVRTFIADRDIHEDRVIWFEHGAANPHSKVGCGIDHAHIHLIIDPPFLFTEFSATARASARLSWRSHKPEELYQSIRAGSYLVSASPKSGIVSENVEHVGSQFFRRLISALAGKPDAWDYRAYPHMDNVRATLATFSNHAVSSERVQSK